MADRLVIKYMLICSLDKGCDHEFEVWFSSSADYDMQSQKGLLICPLCQGTHIEKAIMAPAVKSLKKSKSASEQLAKMVQAMRANIETNCVDVGDKFADEARAIHYGDKPERGIYGQAKPDEAKALIEEGVGIVPIPDMIAPKPKKKLN